MHTISPARKAVSIALKLIVMASAVTGTVMSAAAGRNAFMGGSRVFMYFTIQSNIAIALISAIGCFLLLRKKPIRNDGLVVKLAGTVSITLTGAVFAVLLAVILMPGVFSDHTIETETYVLLALWSVLGLIFFNRVIRKDHARNFGKAIIVWISLLAFIVLMSMTLAVRVNEERENAVVDDIERYMSGEADSETLALDGTTFMEMQRERLLKADNTSAIVMLVLFGMSFAVFIANYSSMKKWESITSKERDQARTAANTDPLTGVKSKHAFTEAEERMEARIAGGEAVEFGVIVCDVNGLKRINDTLGHKAGDEYIRSACMMLCRCYKHSPVYRIGGDEFAVLLQGQDYEAREELLQEVNAQIEVNLGSGGAVASIGMAEYEPDSGETFHEVFKRAWFSASGCKPFDIAG